MIFNVGPSGSKSVEIIADGTTYRYLDTEISNSYFKISPDGTTGWKLWIYASLEVKFNYLVNIDIFAVGKGGNGAGAGGSYEYGYYAGGGGAGGQVITRENVAVNIATAYSVVIGNDATTIEDLDISASRGGNASGRSGGSHVGTGADGGGGRYINDHTYPATNIGPDSGGGGFYAFGDRDFDGIQYANGGGGGDRTPESRGRVYSSQGSGGAGGCSSVGPTGGISGIVIMRNAS